MSKQFRIVFEGQVRADQKRNQVMAQAKLRLGASAAQIVPIFSGQRVTLKQGLDADQAQRYRQALNAIGMEAHIEEQVPEATPPAAQNPMPLRPQPQTTAARGKDDFPDDWMHRSGFERLEVAQQRLADAEALLRPSAAQAARALQQPPAAPAGLSRLHSTFVCSHCGTAHEVESELALRITPSLPRRRAG